MADTKISQLGELTSTSVSDQDIIPVVDVTDTTQSPSGTTKKITRGNLLAGTKVEGQTFNQINVKTLGLLDNQSVPPAETLLGKMYIKNDHKLYYMDYNGIEYAVGLTQQTNTVPSSSGNSPAPNPSTPPSSTPPSADAVSFTQGNSTFSSTPTALSDFNSGSPVTVGSETVTLDTSGTQMTGNCLKFTLDAISNEVAVNKDLSTFQTRDFKFKYRVNSSATINGEHTLFHAWNDNYKANLIQIRITPSGSGFNFLLRAPGTDNFASLVRKSTKLYAKGTTYNVELYFTDGAFHLLVDGNLIIEWYGFDNAGQYIGGISLGKFYSTNFVGIQYMQAINFYQDYVSPTGPTTLSGQIADAWAGWKKRYLRADGAVVRPITEGYNGIYQPSSDVVSEAMGYGLMLAVQMNDYTAFDLMEAWTYANLDRRNLSITPGTNLMGWHYDDVNNVIYDKNWATDADIDRVTALVWASKRKAKGDTGWASSSIDYASRATAIASDLKSYAFRQDGTDYYFCSDAYQGSAVPAEINPSYTSVGGFKVLRDFTGDTFWDQAIVSAYKLLNSAGSATLTDVGTGQVQVGVGLPPDWCGYNINTHSVVNPPNNRYVKYSYDAFRTPMRVYWHYLWFANSSAQAYLNGSLRTFFLNQWSANGKIFAEYHHSGAVLGAYEKSMMTAVAYYILLTQSPTDPTATAIYNTKLANLYKKIYVGGFYLDNTNTTGVYQGAPSYFNNSWMLLAMLIKNNQWVNFT